MTKAERVAHKNRMAALQAKAREVVSTGCCPDCGNPLKRNLALAGWFQCVAYASLPFRAPEHRALPKCDFQAFTE